MPEVQAVLSDVERALIGGLTVDRKACASYLAKSSGFHGSERGEEAQHQERDACTNANAPDLTSG
jgi:hypothetical protein